MVAQKAVDRPQEMEKHTIPATQDSGIISRILTCASRYDYQPMPVPEFSSLGSSGIRAM